MGCVYSGRSDVEATVEVLLSEVLHTAAGVIGGIDSGSSIGAFIALKAGVNKFKGSTINNLGGGGKIENGFIFSTGRPFEIYFFLEKGLRIFFLNADEIFNT